MSDENEYMTVAEVAALKRRRPPRAVTKQANRDARSARWELVHAAGCTHPGCAAKQGLAEDAAADPPPRPVSVPRSLRPYLGRWIGGAK